MDYLWDKITEWLKEMLVGGITSNLSNMFDATNQKVAEISVGGWLNTAGMERKYL